MTGGLRAGTGFAAEMKCQRLRAILKSEAALRAAAEFPVSPSRHDLDVRCPAFKHKGLSKIPLRPPLSPGLSLAPRPRPEPRPAPAAAEGGERAASRPRKEAAQGLAEAPAEPLRERRGRPCKRFSAGPVRPGPGNAAGTVPGAQSAGGGYAPPRTGQDYAAAPLNPPPSSRKPQGTLRLAATPAFWYNGRARPARGPSGRQADLLPERLSCLSADAPAAGRAPPVLSRPA
jgi:hypothetical protein